MSPTQTLTQTDLYSQIQEIISSKLTWQDLTPNQKTLFANPLLLISLGATSNQEAFNLIKAQPDLLFTPQEELNSTVDGALLAQLVEEMNQQKELESSLRTNLSNYSLDQQELIEKLVEIRRTQILQEQLQKDQTVLEEIRPEVNQLNPKQNPRSNLVQTAQAVIHSAITTSSTTFTPSQKAAAVKAFVTTSLTTNLNLTRPQDLGLIISTSLTIANPKYKSPAALTYQQIEQATTPATNQDYQQAIKDPSPAKIIDPQANIVINTTKLPSPNQTNPQIIAQSGQKIITQILSFTTHKDFNEISAPLVTEIKKLHTINESLKANKISQKIITSLSNQQIDKLTHTINQIDPTILQPPTLAAQKTTALLQETTPQNSTLSPSTTKLYGQGLTSKTWAKLYKNARIQKLVSPRQAYIFNQQLKTLDQSQLGREIKPQPLTGFTRRFQAFTNKISGKLPSGFTKPLNYLLHPIQSIKGWFAKKIGQHLGRKIYKAFAKKIKNKTARLIAKTLLRKGLKQGVKTLIKLGIKGGLQLAAQATNVIPGLGLIIAAGIEIISFVGKKIIGGIQNLARSIWGEKLKTRDLLALPAMAAAGIGSIFTSLGTATVAAAGSAGATIAISAAAGIFIYLTAFTVAPLISTIAQLESQPGLSYNITSPTGPIPPGCPSGWPTPSGRITQGPKTSSTHYGVEAIDIGVGLGTPIFATHPGRAIAVGSSGPYGNYVDVYGVCQGVSFITRYAHMPNVPFYGEKLVNTGDQIGVVDNTGNSTGNHLHYEIRGGALGDINQFLPKPVPPGCVEYSQCLVTIP